MTMASGLYNLGGRDPKKNESAGSDEFLGGRARSRIRYRAKTKQRIKGNDGKQSHDHNTQN